MDIKYAVYPGTVTLYDGSERTLTGEELVTLFGIEDREYIIVDSLEDRPDDIEDLEYIHLTPRADNLYPNMKAATHDDDQVITWDRNFDGDKEYTQQTDWKTLRDVDD